VSRVRGLTRAELGGLICETLAAEDMVAVLTGGSCVSVWSNDAYVSDDLDMAITGMATRSRITAAQAEWTSNRLSALQKGNPLTGIRWPPGLPRRVPRPRLKNFGMLRK
jgi:hypothetical protein